jgi:hypothetical protein
MKKKRYMPEGKQDYKEYLSKLSPDERRLVEKFYEDFYGGGVYLKDTVLQSDSAKEEARKNHNSLSRDAMDVSQRRGTLQQLEDNDREFMEYVSDESEWETAYNQQGFKAAALIIYDLAVDDINNNKVDVRVTLTRFFERMSSLKRLSWRDRKHKRTNNK